jgi:uncharacterized protein (TIGR02246 family)
VRIKTSLFGAFLVFSLASTEMTGQPNPSDDEAEIRKRIDDWAAAFRRKDINAVMPVFAPEAVAFDLVPPLAYKGRDAYRKQWERLFASYEGPIEYEIRKLSVTAERDVAFSYSLNRISGTLKNGKKTGLWVRMTACWHKVDGQWLIEHEHVSVPVDLEKDKPARNLKP